MRPYFLSCLFLIILCLIEGKVAFTQTEVEHLRHLLAQAQLEDTTRLRYLLELSKTLRNSQPDLALNYAKEAQKLATRLPLGSEQVRVENALGNLYYLRSDYPQALEHYLGAYNIATNINDKLGLASACSNLGTVYYAQSTYEKAMEYYEKARKLYIELGEKKPLAGVERNIGILYEETGNFAKAIEYYQKVLKFEQETNNPPGVAAAYSSIGGIYLNQDKPKIAIDYFLKALKIEEEAKEKNATHIAACYANLGNAYSIQKKYDKCIDYNEKAYKIQNGIGDKAGMAASLNNIGAAYQHLNRYEKSINYYHQALKIFTEIGNRFEVANLFHNIGKVYTLQNEYGRAVEFLHKSLEVATELKADKILEKCYQTLAEVHAKMESYEKAYYYSRLLAEIKDSIYDAASNRIISELEVRYQTEKKEAEIQYLNRTQQLQQNQIDRQKDIQALLVGVSALVVLLSGVLYNRYRFKQKANLLLEQRNLEIEDKNRALEQANTQLQYANLQIQNILREVSAQKQEIESHNQKIEDSIIYARKIQFAILPLDEMMQKALPNYFILYKPKDIVSGDFYWCARQGNLSFFAIVDCTGHGVPGAFMSVIGANLLNEIVNEQKYIDPVDILAELDRRLRLTLAKTETAKTDDGMDIGFCVLDRRKKIVEYAGAARPLYLLRNGDLQEFRPNKRTIGGEKWTTAEFEKAVIQLQAQDRLYLFSDGLTDQFGGEQKRKLTARRFQSWILTYQASPIQAQATLFAQSLAEWQQDYHQLDDITLLGIEV